ncbi:hypothetical protein [Actinomadura luteofluorescens]|uniref:hypothetical protein n=1 Tax=Actinomadura luteofluorescens TaxID=46163 RepID=UPI003D8AE74E
MRRPRPQYVAAGLIGVVGLVVAALIAVAGLAASGNLPTAPTSYKVLGLAATDAATPLRPA